jgi:uncharacterized delta-60 repeat protein
MSRTHPALRAEALEDRLTPASPGDLDPSFGNGGMVNFQQSPAPQALVALPDGSVVFYTNQLGNAYVAKLRPDGTPDPAYGTAGKAPLPQFGREAITALPDGGVVVAQLIYAGDGNNVVVTRLTASGQPDPTFGTGGTGHIGFVNSSDVQDDLMGTVLVQPDGKVVVVGGDSAGGFNGGFGVVRLTADGQPDPTFGTNGRVTVSIPVNGFDGAVAFGAALQPDGRLVVVGWVMVGTTTISGRGITQTALLVDAAAVRLTAGGQQDPTFGTGGVFRLLPDGGATESGRFDSARVLSDGRIILAGFGTVGQAVRLTPDGNLDPTYGTNGVGTTAGSEDVSQVAPDGRVVFAGVFVARLDPDGHTDTGFGTNGQVDGQTSSPNGSRFPPFELSVAPNGDITTGNSTTGVVERFLGSASPPGFVPSVPGTVLAGGPTDGTARALVPAGGQYTAGQAVPFFPGVPIDIRTATADVNGIPDLIGGAGPGAQPGVMVLDGRTGRFFASPLAFEPSFTGGVFVAAADLDGDGRAEVIATPDQGGGPNVVIFSFNPDGTIASTKSFFALGNPAFRGGARVAVGDVNGDGVPDVIVGAGFLGGPNVEVHDGKAVMAGNYDKLIGSGFFAFDGPDAQTLRNGVFLAAGDVNGDGFADLIAGGGPGGGPRVLILDGKRLSAGDVAGAYAAPVANFFFGDAGSRGGVRVATTRAAGDSTAAVVVGSGEGQPSQVRVYRGKDFTGAGEPATFQDLDPFGVALPGGVFVG